MEIVMRAHEVVVIPRDNSLSAREPCPTWCVTSHRPELGEEDWLHSSEPVAVGDEVPARLVMSIDPGTGEVDGPYVLIGTAEYSLMQATAFAAGLRALVSMSNGAEPLADPT